MEGDWPFLLLGCLALPSLGWGLDFFLGVRVGWPFTGLKLGLVLPSWARVCVGVCVCVCNRVLLGAVGVARCVFQHSRKDLKAQSALAFAPSRSSTSGSGAGNTWLPRAASFPVADGAHGGVTILWWFSVSETSDEKLLRAAKSKSNPHS